MLIFLPKRVILLLILLFLLYLLFFSCRGDETRTHLQPLPLTAKPTSANSFQFSYLRFTVFQRRINLCGDGKHHFHL